MKKFLMKKRSIKKLIPDCEILPKFYRTAYYDVRRMQRICYPFGLHYIVMFLYWLWRKSFWHKRYIEPDHKDNMLKIYLINLLIKLSRIEL